MDRRRLLSTIGLGASVAGCARLAGLSPTSVDTPTIAVQADEEPSPDAEMEVEVLDQFSAESPARIEVSYTNTADTERRVYLGKSPPFSHYQPAGDDPVQMLLIPDDRSHFSTGGFIEPGDEPVNTPSEQGTRSPEIVPDEPENGCWRIGTNFVVWVTSDDDTLSPGETISQRYTVLAPRDVDTCLPDGSYRFEYPHYFGKDRPWGFTVSVTRE